MAGWLALAAAVIAVTAAAVYWRSLQVHPHRPCGACGGSGKTRDRIWKPATGTCPKCLGGRVPRLGVRVLQPARARRMLGAEPSHKTADERKRP